jgi:hypothetical protein
MGMPKPTKKNIKFFTSTITTELKNVKGIKKKRVASKRVKGGDSINNEGIMVLGNLTVIFAKSL